MRVPSKSMSAWAGAVFVALALFGAVVGCTRLGVGADHSEWRLLGNGDDQQFYSAMNQINDGNVQELGLAWYADLPTPDGAVGNPLVANGIVFQSSSMHQVFANDVRTGELLWTYDPQQDLDGGQYPTYMMARASRGVALWGDNVYIATADCRMVALDQRTGREVWDVSSCDKAEGVSQAAAPRVVGDKIVIGNACIDSGAQRGYVTAFDAATGEMAWRFYTVPGDPSRPQENEALERALPTWGTDWYSRTQGCGSVWESINYDPDLNLVFMGTAPAAPWDPRARAPDAGDQLYAGAIVAVNADTGEYVWHFTESPGDPFGYEPLGFMTADVRIDGRDRRVLFSIGKNGVFYVLDARTGELISARNAVPQNWYTQLDPQTGRPTLNPEIMYWNRPDGQAIVMPGLGGAHAFHAMAFSPTTGLVYIPAQIYATKVTLDPSRSIGGMDTDLYYQDENFPAYGRLVAWDPVTQQERWGVNHELVVNGGTLATGGNLVFQGTADGRFIAFRADSGEELWSFDAQGSVQAGATTVEVDGEQYILVPSGNGASSVFGTMMPRYTTSERSRRAPSRLLAFRLGGTATLPEVPAAVPFPRPPLPPFPEAQARRGAAIAVAQVCDTCHGLYLEGGVGSVPDLRRTGELRHTMFYDIVHDGILRQNGMPPHDGLSREEIEALQAYVINTAWANYNAQESARQQPDNSRR